MRLFIHIPKNGGMSVRRGFKDRILLATKDRHISKDYTAALIEQMKNYSEGRGFEHARWRDVREDIRNKYPAFAVVRNPYSRTVSRYAFAVKVGHQSGKQSFRKFLDERHEYGGLPYFWHRGVLGWYLQKDYVTDNGNLVCDILRTECLADDFKKYFGRYYGTKHNVSVTGMEMLGIKDYRELYGSEEYDIVTDWYYADIDFFGFTFDSAATKNIADCLHIHTED